MKLLKSPVITSRWPRLHVGRGFNPRLKLLPTIVSDFVALRRHYLTKSKVKTGSSDIQSKLFNTALRFNRVPYADQMIIFIFVCFTCFFIADAVLPELLGTGKTKDYPLWYKTGRAVVDGTDIYAKRLDGTLGFLYPPFAAILLAPLTLLGKSAMYLMLALLNLAAWIGAIKATMKLSTFSSFRKASQLVASVITLPLVYMTFDLGQPNLILLALVLGGFVAIEARRKWTGGLFIGLAISIKAFPITILPYLIIKRQWTVVAYSVVIVTVCSLAIPISIMGRQKAIDGVKTWSSSMTSLDSSGLAQRPGHSWGYKNQSLIAVIHRLSRPIDIEGPNRPDSAMFINLANLGFSGANILFLAVAICSGGAFLLLLVCSTGNRLDVRACEIGILLSLTVIASPLARNYYFVWLLYPIAVLVNLILTTRRSSTRAELAVALAIVVCLMVLSIEGLSIYFQGYGSLLGTAGVLIFALSRYIIVETVMNLNPPYQHLTKKDESINGA